MMHLPKELKTPEDLETVYNYLYAQEQQRTDLRHLRFGQFLFNCYGIEYRNSYNEIDSLIVLDMFQELLPQIESYLLIDSLLKQEYILKLPKELSNV